jgi:hypothetical protein
MFPVFAACFIVIQEKLLLNFISIAIKNGAGCVKYMYRQAGPCTSLPPFALRAQGVSCPAGPDGYRRQEQLNAKKIGLEIMYNVRD